jgi:Tfp pilus assembly protein PilZ
MKTKPEQRQISGRTTYVIAEYTVLEGTFRDFIKHIGAGGLFIKTDRKIAVGQPVSTRFPLFNFDNIVQANGRVVRRDADGVAVTFTEAFEGLVCKEGHFPEIVFEGDHANQFIG